ncbi:MAG: VapC toxin family PIN domain ribonuclease [Ignavibacteria bacterium CG22_combo_CG10-13_8_21_14_all_37_15]|nr:type II toxin-antitoxin system VapC family toxin [Ignavibacteria bacterium]NCS82580.1 type II toxin-antitoxin system VapC family toxin [Ignavibacteria bacterium]OIO22864.1 MAG: VapC toxin family PIN domain ribonuclease [Ignavibacteria bacterium CG1_02_37_35]PIP77629.1 MAG: VapC toxin family PIN domain ribonuclease [Ignavibacteria bacterium CG22_combo_CG10-13_8_21_14_all_37_15]
MTMIDTDVLIWYMRGNIKAKEVIEKLNGFFISVVTYMELVQGMRNKSELTLLRSALRKWDVKILFINEDISAKAMFLVEEHYLSNSLVLADALIASTAVSNGLTLLTGNTKHYKVIKNLELEEFKP